MILLKRSIVIFLLVVSLFSALFAVSHRFNYDSMKFVFESISSGSLSSLSTDVQCVGAIFKYWSSYNPSFKQYFREGYGWNDGNGTYTYSLTLVTERPGANDTIIYDRTLIYTQSSSDRDSLRPPYCLELMLHLDHDAFNSSVFSTLLSCVQFILFVQLSLLLVVWFLVLLVFDVVVFTLDLCTGILYLLGL